MPFGTGPIPGEQDALFVAAVCTLSGVLLSMLGFARSKARKPGATAYELLGLALAGLGTAFGLWRLAGSNGFLLVGVTAVVVVAVIWAITAATRWSINKEADGDQRESDQDHQGS